jgi:hypothetical protein
MKILLHEDTVLVAITSRLLVDNEVDVVSDCIAVKDCTAVRLHRG